MSKAKGYILKLEDDRLNRLRQSARDEEPFAEPVDEFKHSRNQALVCFITDRSGELSHIAFGSRGLRAGTELRRLNLEELTPVGLKQPFAQLILGIKAPTGSRIATRLKTGGLLSAVQLRALADGLIDAEPALEALLFRFSSRRSDQIRAIPVRAKEQLAMQKDSVGLALSLAGLKRRALREWSPPPQGLPRSFLDGLPQTRSREDSMIVNDLKFVPGFARIRDHIQGSSVFRDAQGTQLTVVLANRLALEELTGCDLIYYNETYRSFVMVQYKAMEGDENEAIYRLPDTQLESEIDRMEGLLSGLPVEDDLGPDAFRLSAVPFFLKLCPRIVLRPDGDALTRGMYLPLDKFKRLAASASAVGKNGGKGITYRNVRRHIDNSTFVAMVQDAWVGTTPLQSSVVEEAIRESLASGRAVLFAKRTGPSRVARFPG